ncbi:TRAP transporter small permease [Pseudomonas sp. FME51]|uniref:TRAP transporter small permease n=1 Tax=Pseudomonas sp. FME51 TaxID=2742609 RepID=UPI001D016CF7|nr:TRAP transporter small permease [Pseudomonas sp. FME51]
MPEPAARQAKHSNKNALIRILGLADRLIERVEKFILGGSVLFLTGLLILHVLGRQLLDRGVTGQVELTQFSLVIMTFAGLGYAVRRARHIAMSAFYDQLRGWPRKALLVCICITSGALMLFLAWHAWAYVDSIRAMSRTSSALSIPLWIPYLIAPIGFALATIQYWLTAIRNLTSDKLYRSFTELERYDEVPVDHSNQE